MKRVIAIVKKTNQKSLQPLVGETILLYPEVTMSGDLKPCLKSIPNENKNDVDLAQFGMFFFKNYGLLFELKKLEIIDIFEEEE